MTTPSLKNASVVITGTANLLLLFYFASTIVRRNASYEDYLQFYEWPRLFGCPDSVRMDRSLAAVALFTPDVVGKGGGIVLDSGDILAMDFCTSALPIVLEYR